MLQSMGSQRVGHDRATEQQQLPTSNLLTLSPSSCLENLPTLDTAVCCQLAGSTSGYPLSVAAVKRKKRGMSFFSFPFLRKKKIKRTVSQPEHS